MDTMSLTEIARSTLAIVDAGGYVAPSGARRELRADVDGSLAGTRLYTPAELEALIAAPSAPAPRGAPRIEVTTETTAAAARRLASEGASVCALNFASAKNPGGGFVRGAKAQEEDVCRVSALYPCLLTQRAYYDENRACGTMLYTDHLIYSPAVPFFRDDRYDLLETPYRCSVITSPAPNAGEELRRDPDAQPAISRTLVRRTAMVLAVAAAHRERNLVLGAWGCGVFRNDPAEVAAVFADALAAPRFAGAFDRIVHAVWSRTDDDPNLIAFRRRFAA